MNVREINGSHATLHLYFAIIVPLTMVTVWIVVAVQIKYLSEKPDEITLLSQLLWPYTSVGKLIRRYRRSKLSSNEKRILAAV
jgi:hypothetical protein